MLQTLVTRSVHYTTTRADNDCSCFLLAACSGLRVRRITIWVGVVLGALGYGKRDAALYAVLCCAVPCISCRQPHGIRTRVVLTHLLLDIKLQGRRLVLTVVCRRRDLFLVTCAPAFCLRNVYECLCSCQQLLVRWQCTPCTVTLVTVVPAATDTYTGCFAGRSVGIPVTLGHACITCVRIAGNHSCWHRTCRFRGFTYD